MTETVKKAPAKKAPAKKAAAPKVAASKAAPKAKAANKTGATITIEQIGSPIGRTDDQAATLRGLGLNKLHRVRTLEDTPAIRGMIRAVRHMVRIVD